MRSFIASDQATEWGTAALVCMIAMLMGGFAAQGMNAVQWAGAATAVLGSITLAVLVRVWPEGKTAEELFED